MVKKSNFLWFDKKILVLLIAFYIQNVTSFWEYAVCTKEKIILYDKNWAQLEPSIVKDGFKHMKAITYDPVNDVFYFTDRQHPQTSIFSLKVNDDTTFLTTPLVPRSSNEVIEDLVYDAHDNTLYWSDSGNKKIVKLVFDRSKNLKWRNETFLDVTGEVSGLELDSCKRNLYYTIVTDANPSINVVSIDRKGDKPVSFGNENHYKPIAIAMDHQERRLYIADVKQYNSYSIDSLAADGSDFRTEIDKAYKTPRSVAVDSYYIYYVEGNGHELRRFAKGLGKKDSEKFIELPFDPSDIIVRGNFVTDLDAEKCKLPADKINQVKKEIEEKAQKKETPNKMCLHGGSLDKTTSSCMCMENYDGDFCEINLCYNFCLNGGDCSMNRNEKTKVLVPTCSCKRGFVGEHCEIDVCANYCLNDGTCSVGSNKKPRCGCGVNFEGARCENLKVETSPVLIESNEGDKKVSRDVCPERYNNYCLNGGKCAVIGDKQHEVSCICNERFSGARCQNEKADTVPESSEQLDSDFHQELAENLTKNQDKNTDEVPGEVQQCSQNAVNGAYVIIAVCITTSLLLFLAILSVIKRMHRPMRPKIRKKFVVHKNIEPLTYRPTTEQCEVIIEDCCNMNICETPCFDPKVLQQEINDANISVKLTSSKKCNSKEDKQDLLKNMEYNQ